MLKFKLARGRESYGSSKEVEFYIEKLKSSGYTVEKPDSNGLYEVKEGGESLGAMTVRELIAFAELL